MPNVSNSQNGFDLAPVVSTKVRQVECSWCFAEIGFDGVEKLSVHKFREGLPLWKDVALWHPVRLLVDKRTEWQFGNGDGRLGNRGDCSGADAGEEIAS